jgi:hypothetical protein
MNRVLRKICGAKTRGSNWHNYELHKFYCSLDIKGRGDGLAMWHG